MRQENVPYSTSACDVYCSGLSLRAYTVIVKCMLEYDHAGNTQNTQKHYTGWRANPGRRVKPSFNINLQSEKQALRESTVVMTVVLDTQKHVEARRCSGGFVLRHTGADTVCIAAADEDWWEEVLTVFVPAAGVPPLATTPLLFHLFACLCHSPDLQPFFFFSFFSSSPPTEVFLPL